VVNRAHGHVVTSLREYGFLQPQSDLIAEEMVNPKLKSQKKRTKEGFIVSLDGETLIKGSEEYNGYVTTSFTLIKALQLYSHWLRSLEGSKLNTISSHKSISNVSHYHDVQKLLSLLCRGRNQQHSRERSTNSSRVGTSEFHHASVYRLYDEFSWLRVRGKLEFTPWHADIFYFKSKSNMFNSSKVDDDDEVDDDDNIKISGIDDDAKLKQCCLCNGALMNVEYQPSTNGDNIQSDSSYRQCEECRLYFHNACNRQSNRQQSSSCKLLLPICMVLFS